MTPISTILSQLARRETTIEVGHLSAGEHVPDRGGDVVLLADGADEPLGDLVLLVDVRRPPPPVAALIVSATR